MMLKHTDDDGDLSIFASGNEILIACQEGHYWVLEAPMRTVTATRPRSAAKHRGEIDGLIEKFGPGVGAVMKNLK